MSLNIQETHTKSLWRHRRHNFSAALIALSKIETSNPITTAVMHSATMHATATKDQSLFDVHTKELNYTSFATNFRKLTFGVCVLFFRFKHEEIMSIVPFFGWLAEQTCKKFDGYIIDPLMATCVVPRRMAIANRWYDLEFHFGKHS